MARLYPKRPVDYVRCTGCGRLTEKSNAGRGPDGGTYGEDCLALAVQAARDDPLAEARAIAADLASVRNGDEEGWE